MSENGSDRIRLGYADDQLLATKIVVADMDASLSFYRDVLGLRELTCPILQDVSRDSSGNQVRANLNASGSASDTFLVLLKGVPPPREYSRLICLVVKIKELGRTLERVNAAGAELASNQVEFKGLLGLLVRDPDGYTVELNQVDVADCRERV
jgi:catechol 2,3-dioxygenase-like lactoylglutathione lyase family enzyme